MLFHKRKHPNEKRNSAIESFWARFQALYGIRRIIAQPNFFAQNYHIHVIYNSRVHHKFTVLNQQIWQPHITTTFPNKIHIITQNLISHKTYDLLPLTNMCHNVIGPRIDNHGPTVPDRHLHAPAYRCIRPWYRSNRCNNRLNFGPILKSTCYRHWCRSRIQRRWWRCTRLFRQWIVVNGY